MDSNHQPFVYKTTALTNCANRGFLEPMVGFEPTRGIQSPSCLQDRFRQPLEHIGIYFFDFELTVRFELTSPYGSDLRNQCNRPDYAKSALHLRK